MTTLPDFLAGAEERMVARKAAAEMAAAKAAADASDRKRKTMRRAAPYIVALAALIVALFVYQHFQREWEMSALFARGLEGDGILHPWAERPSWSPDRVPGDPFLSYTFDLSANGGRLGGCMANTEINVSAVVHRVSVCVPDRLAEIYRQVGPQTLEEGRDSAYVVIRDGRPCVRFSGSESRRIRDEDQCLAPGENVIPK